MTVKGADILIRQLSELPRKLQRPIQDALEASAAEMMSLAARRLQKNSSGGRVYKRGKKSHRASAPGDYPNTDTGELVRSLFWEKRGALQAVWGANANHARPLEFGTSRMAARPFVRPTFLDLQSRASNRVLNAIAGVVRGVRG